MLQVILLSLSICSFCSTRLLKDYKQIAIRVRALNRFRQILQDKNIRMSSVDEVAAAQNLLDAEDLPCCIKNDREVARNSYDRYD